MVPRFTRHRHAERRSWRNMCVASTGFDLPARPHSCSSTSARWRRASSCAGLSAADAAWAPLGGFGRLGLDALLAASDLRRLACPRCLRSCCMAALSSLPSVLGGVECTGRGLVGWRARTRAHVPPVQQPRGSPSHQSTRFAADPGGWQSSQTLRDGSARSSWKRKGHGKGTALSNDGATAQERQGRFPPP